MRRRSIFVGKAGGDRLQGIVTKAGSAAFEEKRRRLTALAQGYVKQASDGDTLEYLCRGEAETIREIAKRLKGK